MVASKIRDGHLPAICVVDLLHVVALVVGNKIVPWTAKAGVVFLALTILSSRLV